MRHVLALHFEQQERTPKPHTALLSQCFYHTSVRRESMLIMGGAGMLAAGVLAGKFLEMSASASESKEIDKQPEQGKSQDNSDNKMSSTSTLSEKDEVDETAPATKAGFFAKNFYDGGFEEKMTRREAALILGVRENTAAQRIKESHRKILLLNHPDRGGSPYVAAKINLAKDLLLQGKGK
eukprot:GSChrysophyteH1.ASY1.ANO1.2750.1 assembled CDS